MTSYPLEQRICLKWHVTIVAEASRRVRGVVGVLFEKIIAFELVVALGAGSVLFGDRMLIVIAKQELVVGRSVVHTVTGKASHLPFFVAGRLKRSLVFQRRGSRGSVAPEILAIALFRKFFVFIS